MNDPIRNSLSGIPKPSLAPFLASRVVAEARRRRAAKLLRIYWAIVLAASLLVLADIRWLLIPVAAFAAVLVAEPDYRAALARRLRAILRQTCASSWE